ncbi:hypothetical protein HJA_09339 [Hyphomonas jannaschiana VP2]|jgi:uncharacterized small protein (DUF1192 family)|uniref:DUF1192 domain-containing protein n=2 Tax=Hyphomonas jannaschiana TaxID=86 RepID=A0A059FDF1_9PROT|nr:hypothetical protein HJA_09339 [Hyphomonas jannaschiana VP2]
MMAISDEEPILVNTPQTLEQMSVEELEVRIAQLKDGIAACEREIEKKRAQKAAADALFGGGGD